MAGAPLSNDVVSCALEALDPADYDVTFTPQEWAELERIFPDGVCDWSRPDAQAVGLSGMWLSFGPSEVNRVR